MISPFWGSLVPSPSLKWPLLLFFRGWLPIFVLFFYAEINFVLNESHSVQSKYKVKKTKQINTSNILNKALVRM